MKTYRVATVAVLLLAGLAAMASPYYDKDKGDAGRLLMGRVTDHADNPLPSAVVYLSNPRRHKDGESIRQSAASEHQSED